MAGACGGETPARLIRRVVLASASRSGGGVAPVVTTGRCFGLRPGPRQYPLGTICCAFIRITLAATPSARRCRE